MLSRWLAAFALSAVACAGVRASEKPQTWIEVRSPNFTVISNANVKAARDAAEHFEQIRAAYKAALPDARVDPGEPLLILAVKNEKDLATLLPAYWEQKGHMHPAGLFVGGMGKNFIALRLDAEGDNPYQVVYHEYVHLLERLNFDRLPLWLSEGLAEFMGNTTITGKGVYLGRAIRSHLELLRETKKIPLETLLTADASSPYYNEANLTSAFYAQSWELTDYLYLADNGAHFPMLEQYIKLVRQDVGDLQAARSSFGDLKQLAKKLDEYSRGSRFDRFTVLAPFIPHDKNFSERALTPAESAAIRGDFQVYMNRPVEARALLEEAIRADPKLASAYESLGFLALQQGDLDAAEKWLSQAVALDSKSYLANYYQAMLSARGLLTPDQIALVENRLHRVIELNPKFAPAYATLAQFYAARGSELDQAMELARRAVALEPGSVQAHLSVGAVLLHEGKLAEAQVLGERLLAAAHSPQDREEAQIFLMSLRQYQQFEEQKKRAAEAAGQQPILLQKRGPASEGSAAAPSTQPAAQPDNQSDQPAAETPADESPAPAIADGEGRVAAVACSGKELSLTLDLYGYTTKLHAPDYSKITFPATAWHPPAGFSPCVSLKNKNVKVQYQVVAGKPYAGEIVSIAVQPK